MSNAYAQNHERIAILGSAFDPLHYAHAALAILPLFAGYADKVWLVPCPPRWDKTPLASSQTRLSWATLCANHLSSQGWAVEAKDDEIASGEFRGTYVFLKSLEKKYPGCLFSILIGADNLASLPTWRDPVANQKNGELLMKEYEMLVTPRPGFLHSQLPQNAKMLPTFEETQEVWRPALQLPHTQIEQLAAHNCEAGFRKENFLRNHGLSPELQTASAAATLT